MVHNKTLDTIHRPLLVLLAMGAILCAFFSPVKVVAGLCVLGIALVTFRDPKVAILFLAVLIPLEPFLLKFVPDDIYVYARYFSEVLVYCVAATVCLKRLVEWARGEGGPARKGISPILIVVGLLILDALLSAFINQTPFTVALLGIRQIIRFIILFGAVALLRPDRLFVKRLCVVVFSVLLFESSLGIAQAVIGAPADNFLIPGVRKVLGDVQLTTGTTQFWESGQRVFATMGRYDQLGTFLCLVLLLGVGMVYEVLNYQTLRLRYRGLSGPGNFLLKIPSYSRRRGPYAPVLSKNEVILYKTQSFRDPTKPGISEGSAIQSFPGLVFIFIFLLGLPALVLTYSRASWFGFALGLFVIGWFVKKDKKILVGTLALASAFIVYLLFSWGVVSQLVDTPRQTVLERLSESISPERWRGEYYGLGRLYYIVHTPLDIVSRSVLFGVGPGSYGGGAAAALHYTEQYNRAHLPFGIYGTEGYIDNNWFSIWGELGTVGLALTGILFVLLFRTALRVYRTSSDPLICGVALGFCGIVAAVSLQAFLATYLEVRTLAFYFWLFAGIVVQQELVPPAGGSELGTRNSELGTRNS